MSPSTNKSQRAGTPPTSSENTPFQASTISSPALSLPPHRILAPRRKKTGKRKRRRPPLYLTPVTVSSDPPRHDPPQPVSSRFDKSSWISGTAPPVARLLGPQLSRWARTNIGASRWWVIAEPSPDEQVKEKTPVIDEDPTQWEEEFQAEPEYKDEITGIMDYEPEDFSDDEYLARMGMKFSLYLTPVP